VLKREIIVFSKGGNPTEGAEFFAFFVNDVLIEVLQGHH